MTVMTVKNTIFENILDSNGLFQKHFHSTYTIGITHDGFFKSFIQNKSSISYKQSTRIINPYEIHYGDSKSWKYTNFYPSISLLEEIHEQIFFEKKVPLFTEHIIEDKILYKLLWNLFNSVYIKSSYMNIETNLIETLSYIVKNYTSDKKNANNFPVQKEKIINTLEYIHDNIEYTISLDNLAKNVNLSKYHFLRIFKEHIGLTPHQYIIMNRVNKAKELIIKGESLSMASLYTGFNDQSHFIKNFRKIYGYSPKELQKKENFIKI